MNPQDALAQRLACAKRILQLTQEQLELARRDDDEMPAAFEQNQAERGLLMAQIDRIKPYIPADAAHTPPGQAYLETIRQCAAIDEQVRRALTEALQSHQGQMRASRETQKGLQAYMGAQEQTGGLFFDKKN